MALMEVTLIPMGTATTSCSPYIARVLDIAKADPNITYQLNPMGTVLEGELSALYRCRKHFSKTVFNVSTPLPRSTTVATNTKV